MILKRSWARATIAGGRGFQGDVEFVHAPGTASQSPRAGFLASPLGGRRAAPAPERPREYAGRRVAERLGDLADLVGRVFEHLPRGLESCFVQKLLEADAETVETAIQRAGVHAEKRGDVVRLVLAGRERGLQEASHLAGEIIAVGSSSDPISLSRRRRISSSIPARGASGAPRRTTASRSPRRSGTVRGRTGETDRRPPEGGVRTRPRLGLQSATAQFMHDVVQGRERAIPDVIDGLHPRFVDVPGQHCRLPSTARFSDAPWT